MQNILRAITSIAAGTLICASTFAEESVDLDARFEKGHLTFTTDKGDVKFWIDGRIMFDAVVMSNDLDPAIEEDFLNGSEVRRARLALKSKFHERWFGEFDIDFAEDEVETKDLWMAYAPNSSSLIKLGNQKMQSSMDEVTSSRNLIFMERSMIGEFTPGRKMALSASTWGDNWMIYAGGAFGAIGDEEDPNQLAIDRQALADIQDLIDAGGTDPELFDILNELLAVIEDAEVDAFDRDESEQYGVSTRAVFNPVLKDDRMIHLGLSFSRFKPESSFENATHDRVRVRARALHPTGRVLSAQVRNTDYYTLTGLELAARMGNLIFQSEYMMADYSRLDGNPDYSYSGNYAMVSYLFGGYRPYDNSVGEFLGATTSGQRGAFEIAARIDSMDLNDNADGRGMQGAVQVDTIALNWYPNRNVKFGINVAHVNGDKNSETQGDEFQQFGARAQLLF